MIIFILEYLILGNIIYIIFGYYETWTTYLHMTIEDVLIKMKRKINIINTKNSDNEKLLIKQSFFIKWATLSLKIWNDSK